MKHEIYCRSLGISFLEQGGISRPTDYVSYWQDKGVPPPK